MLDIFQNYLNPIDISLNFLVPNCDSKTLSFHIIFGNKCFLLVKRQV